MSYISRSIATITKQILNYCTRNNSIVRRIAATPATLARTWTKGFIQDISGPHGYRTIAVVVSIYFALFALFEAAHERQMNRATFEHAMLINMVSANNRQLFISAMKNFGRIQTMSVTEEPSLLKPLSWLSVYKPNFLPLHTWAISFLDECTAKDCGITCDGDCEDDRAQFRIDLHGANLQQAGLCYVDLTDKK